ncbi:MAG: c-type cytochrome, partial [Sphingopyxis sp.]
GRPGGWNAGIDFLANGVPDDPAAFRAVRAMLKGQLIAWDPIAQKEVWRVQYDGPWNGGVLATHGGLVFQGNAHGELAAFSATDGRKLWSFAAGTGIIAPPISYSVDGVQYIAVMAGYGGAYPLSSSYVDDPRPMPNGRMLVFKIGGNAPYQVAQTPQPPAVQVAGTFTPAQVDRGMRLYESTCAVCHGPSGMSSGVLPDLRRRATIADADVFKSIVIDGALKDRGMISFARYMSPADAESVRAYLASRARVAAAREAPATTPTPAHPTGR